MAHWPPEPADAFRTVCHALQRRATAGQPGKFHPSGPTSRRRRTRTYPIAVVAAAVLVQGGTDQVQHFQCTGRDRSKGGELQASSSSVTPLANAISRAWPI